MYICACINCSFSFIYRNSTWSSHGLSLVGYNNSYIECSSEHLTAFSVLVGVHGGSQSTTRVLLQVVTYNMHHYNMLTGVKSTNLCVIYWMWYCLALFDHCSLYGCIVQVNYTK